MDKLISQFESMIATIVASCNDFNCLPPLRIAHYFSHVANCTHLISSRLFVQQQLLCLHLTHFTLVQLHFPEVSYLVSLNLTYLLLKKMPKKKGRGNRGGDDSDEDIPSLLNAVDFEDAQNESIVTNKKGAKKGKTASKQQKEAPRAAKGTFLMFIFLRQIIGLS